MKIKLSYTIEHEKEIEISAEEYCYLRTNYNYNYNNFFPKEAQERRIFIVDGIDELNDFIYEKPIEE